MIHRIRSSFHIARSMPEEDSYLIRHCRGILSSMETCRRGHPRTPENIRVYGKIIQCKVCEGLRLSGKVTSDARTIGEGRICPQGHTVSGDNCRKVGNRYVCIACSDQVQIEYRKRERERCLQAYGNKCVCCGESEQAFLCIDHVNDDGNEHRRSATGGNKVGGGMWIYREARREGYPSKYQLLCWNCNYAKRLPEGCPHKRVGDAQ